MKKLGEYWNKQFEMDSGVAQDTAIAMYSDRVLGHNRVLTLKFLSIISRLLLCNVM